MHLPQRRQCACAITAGMESVKMQFCGQTVPHFPQPVQSPDMTYPSGFAALPPKANETRSIGFFERSNHSPVPS